MGDRVSIQFVDKDEKSVVLFHHWGGTEFPKEASNYIKNELPKRLGEVKKNFSDPGSRREPNTIMVDFVSYHCAGDVVRTSLYFGKDAFDGDNSDNRHYEIDVHTGEMFGDNEDNEEDDD